MRAIAPALAVVVAIVLSAAQAVAQAPPVIPVQGVVMDTAGAPISGALDVAFTLYASSDGAQSLWTETQSVTFDGGAFAAYLGDTTALDLALFRDQSSVYLGVAINGDQEMDLVRIATAPYAGFAQYCAQAESVGQTGIANIVSQVSDQIGDTTHARYTDGEAVAAMGPEAETNTLNHSRFTVSEAVAAMGGASNSNTLNHTRYTDAEAQAAFQGTGSLVLGSGANDELTAADVATLTGGGDADALHTHAAQKNPWFLCGTVVDISSGALFATYPVEEYSFGFKYNGPQVVEADITGWNRGTRIYNRHPYMVQSDNPSVGAGYGGTMWYTGTDATDDDVPSGCPVDTWRHRYWRLDGTVVVPLGGNGCATPEIYCKELR